MITPPPASPDSAEHLGALWAALPPRPQLDLTPHAIRIDGLEQTEVGKRLVAGGIGSFEPETTAASLAILEEFEIQDYLDVGANIGFFSLVIKALLGAAVSVVGYEPLPHLREKANKAAAINGLDLEIRGAALSDRPGTGTLFVSAKSDSSNSLNPTFRKSKGTIDVELTTLDAITAEGFEPGLIKIDTESTEPDVLAGGHDFISRARPWIICEILLGRTEDRLADFVAEHGYLGYHLNERPMLEPQQLAGDPTYEYRDWLLAPEPVSDGLNHRYEAWLDACRAVRTPLRS